MVEHEIQRPVALMATTGRTDTFVREAIEEDDKTLVAEVPATLIIGTFGDTERQVEVEPHRGVATTGRTAPLTSCAVEEHCLTSYTEPPIYLTHRNSSSFTATVDDNTGARRRKAHQRERTIQDLRDPGHDRDLIRLDVTPDLARFRATLLAE
jgi:hypothetical protein